MADDKEINKDPYDDLKGYFPKDFDLSPEELEKEITTENKQREIALQMTVPKTSAEGLEPEIIPPIAHADKIEPDEPDENDAYSEPAYDDEPEEQFADMDQTDDEEDESWVPPVAAEITDNELLNKYESLDELLESLEEDESEGEKKESGSKLLAALSWSFDFLEVFTVCMACIILIFTVFGRLTRVDGPSMEDTLKDGQLLIISDFAYTPKAGDIVVVQNTSLSMERLRKPLVKRIIAVGGQTVDVAYDGTVTVTDADGTSRVTDQSFTKDEEYRKSPCHMDIPEGYVFVMGDNRNNSSDSREPLIGLIDERCIFGRAVLRVFPFSEFTLFENPYDN